MSENIEYIVTWADVERRAQERPKIVLAVDDEPDQRDLVSSALQEMDTFWGSEAYFNALTQFEIGIMAEQTPTELAIFVASTHEAGLHAALRLTEAGAAPTILAYDINIMGDNKMNGIEAALDVVALTGGNAPVVFVTAYDAKDFSGFKNAGNSTGAFYIVQKSEGSEKVKTVVREAQYCADVRVVLNEIKEEKERYLARLTTEVGIALQTAIKGKSNAEIDMIGRDLEAICDKAGTYQTFRPVQIYESMQETLDVLDRVKISSSVHPLGNTDEEQNGIDQQIMALKDRIHQVKTALETHQYHIIPTLVENVIGRASADASFYDMMRSDWGNEKGNIMVMGGYVLERVAEKAPGGVAVREGDSNIAEMSYSQKQVERVVTGLQMLLVAGERALREVGAKDAGEDVDVTVDVTSTDNKLYVVLNYNLSRIVTDTAAMKRELEDQLRSEEHTS